MLFTETNETNIGHFHFQQMKLSLINFFHCTVKPWIQKNSSFRCILKTSNVNFRLRNQQPKQDKLVRANEVLIRNFPICIGNKMKQQFKLFSVFENVKYLSTSAKEENCLRCQFTLRMLCLTVWPWDSIQNRESPVKTVSLTAKPSWQVRVKSLFSSMILTGISDAWEAFLWFRLFSPLTVSWVDTWVSL